MRSYGLEIAQSSDITNLTAPSGTAFPSEPHNGELFYRSDSHILYVYGNAQWQPIQSNFLIPEVNETLTSSSIVDAFIYDTTKDSDGGAWTSDVGHTSYYEQVTPVGKFIGRFANLAAAEAAGGIFNDWYARTGSTEFFQLGMPTFETEIFRAGEKIFPRIALIVIETTRVIIYDLTTFSPSMWMVMESVSGNFFASTNNTAAVMLNHTMYVGSNGVAPGLFVIDFYNDSSKLINGTGTYAYSGPISTLNDTSVGFNPNNTTISLQNALVNDVTATKLHSTKTYTFSGLLIPTVALTTDGGGAWMTDNGTIYDTASTTAMSFNAFDDNGRLFTTIGSGALYDVGGFDGPPITDGWDYAKDVNYRQDGAGDLRLSTTTSPEKIDASNGLVAIGRENGFQIIKENALIPSNGMIAQIETTHNSGWMWGDSRLAALANSKTIDLSGNNNTLTENGTITEGSVMTGADLKSYSGWSTSNYLSQAYDADFDFGTNDFSVSGWFKEDPMTSSELILSRAYYSGGFSGSGLQLFISSSSFLVFSVSDDGFTTSDSVSSTFVVDDSFWYHYCVTRKNNTLYLYLNGTLHSTSPISLATGSLSNSNATLQLGVNNDNSSPLTNGALSLLRIAAYAPTEDQIKFAYNTEKHMFRENAQCLLTGTSDDIKSLNFDAMTNRLHVSSTWGQQSFSGLNRVNSESSLVGTPVVVAAHGDIVCNGGSTGSDIFVPEINIKDIALDTLFEPTISNTITNTTNTLLNLPAVDEIVTSTATIDSFIYDTTKDSDGGSWTTNAANASWTTESVPSGSYLGRYVDLTAAVLAGGVAGDWYTRTGSTQFFEIVNSSTETEKHRAGTNTFPKVCLIVAEATALVIYDLTTALPSMWMVFTVGTSANWLQNLVTIESVEMKESVLIVGASNTNGGVYRCEFLTDILSKYNTGGYYIFGGNISNARIGGTGGYSQPLNTNALASNTVYDVSLTSSNTYDAVSGLKLLIVAAGTIGGVSVITETNRIVNSTETSSFRYVKFIDSGLVSSTNSGSFDVGLKSLPIDQIPWSYSEDGLFDSANVLSNVIILPTSKAQHVSSTSDGLVIGNDNGISIIKQESTLSNSMLCNIIDIYNTGWLFPELKGGYLSRNTANEDISRLNNNLTLTGSLNSSPVKANADLLGWSGFSVSNYLSRAYDADFEFGTGDFSISGWITTNTSSTLLVRRWYYNGAFSGPAFSISTSVGYLLFSISDDAYVTEDRATSNASVDDGGWHFFVGTRDGSNIKMYIDGVLVDSNAIVNTTGSLNNASATLHIGIDSDASAPWQGNASLLRIAGYAPTEEQVKYMYDTERLMFSVNAKCFFDTSSNVLSTDFDDVNGKIHATTTWGRNTFQGIVRVDSEATPVGSPTSISAHGDIVSNGGASGSDIFVPELSLRETALDVLLQLNASDTTSTTIVSELAEVNEILTTVAVVDSLIYDTTKDSDGGSWTNNTSHTSWYNEEVPSGKYLGRQDFLAAAINAGGVPGDWYARTGATEFYKITSTISETPIYRAGSKTFPKVVLIVMEATKIIFYDLTKPSAEMWMVFAPGSSSGTYLLAADNTFPFKNMSILSHTLCANMGNGTTVGTNYILDFFTEECIFIGNTADRRLHVADISQRNVSVSFPQPGVIDNTSLVNIHVNAIAMTPLDDAPLHPTSGVKIPTIAWATNGGITIVTHDDNYYDSVETTSFDQVILLSTGQLLSSSVGGDYDVGLNSAMPPTADGWSYFADGFFLDNASALVRILPSTSPMKTVETAGGFAVANSNALHLIHEAPSVADSMVAFIPSIYNSGWHLPELKANYLSNANVTNDTGRLSNNVTLTGSLNSAAVATGAELLAYSGWSASNYLTRAYDVDFDFGTGDFCIYGWFKMLGGSGTRMLVERSAYSGGYSGAAIQVYISSANDVRMAISDDGFGSSDTVDSIGTPIDGYWHQFVAVKNGITDIKMYIDGFLTNTTTLVSALASLNNASATLILGNDNALGSAFNGGSMSLIRIAAYAPTDEQVQHMYNTEKYMFRENAKCFLAGSSDNVTNVTYDANKNYVHVSTSYGRSAFNNLVRIEDEATPVGTMTSLAAHGCIVSNGGSTGSDIFVPELSNREHVLLDHLQEPTPFDDSYKALTLQNSWVDYTPATYGGGRYKISKNGDVRLAGRISTGTLTDGTVVFTLPVGYRPSYAITLYAISDLFNAGSRMVINPDGTAAVYSASNTWLSLDNLVFSIY